MPDWVILVLICVAFSWAAGPLAVFISVVLAEIVLEAWIFLREFRNKE